MNHGVLEVAFLLSFLKIVPTLVQFGVRKLTLAELILDCDLVTKIKLKNHYKTVNVNDIINT